MKKALTVALVKNLEDFVKVKTCYVLQLILEIFIFIFIC